jgi:hypothetical protein
MRRALWVSVSALTLSGLAVAIGYGVSDSRSSNMIEAARGEPAAAQPTSSTAATPDAPTAPALSDAPSTLKKTERPSKIDDAEGTRKSVRDDATREILRVYPLLLDHLGLPQEKKDALISLLIDDRVARTTTLHSRGKALNADERSKQIAAVIGSSKLQQFLALEKNIRSYADVARIGSLLEKRRAEHPDEKLPLFYPAR